MNHRVKPEFNFTTSIHKDQKLNSTFTTLLGSRRTIPSLLVTGLRLNLIASMEQKLGMLQETMD